MPEPTANMALALDALRRRQALHNFLWLLGVVGGAASAYHGYRRTKRVLPTLGWFIAGTLLPPVTLAIAAAQGFAKPK